MSTPLLLQPKQVIRIPLNSLSPRKPFGDSPYAPSVYLFLLASARIDKESIGIGIKQLASPHSAKPPYLYQLAQRSERLAVLVEEDWDSLSDEMKHLLTCLAYDSLEQPRFSLKGLFLRLRWSWMVAFDDEEALLQYRTSFMKLRNAVLEAIESENEDYQADLTEALSSLSFDPNAGRRAG